MLEHICITCQRREGDLEPRPGKGESREVSLSSIHASATSCKLCKFVQELLERDATTPKVEDPSYQRAIVRVDEWGLRFTGQWQGALVIEVYKVGQLNSV